MVVDYVRGCGGRRNEASGWVPCFVVVVAHDLVKSVNGVNGFGSFVKFE